VLITWVNTGEVLYVVRRRRGADAADLVLAALDQLPLETVNAGRALTLEAARLKSRFSIAYADAFCAALAKLTGLPAVTGDPEFRALEREIDLVWL
jgi:ribonuclease VapC